MSIMNLNKSQKRALAKIERLLGYMSIPDGARFQVHKIDVHEDGTAWVWGHVGKEPEARWFESYYSFQIGVRGALVMYSGDKSMEAYNGKRWCGIRVKLTLAKKEAAK